MQKLIMIFITILWGVYNQLRIWQRLVATLEIAALLAQESNFLNMSTSTNSSDDEKMNLVIQTIKLNIITKDIRIIQISYCAL